MSDLVTLKPIAVSSFRMLYEFVFETQANKLNCEQVAAGYNGMIVEIAQLRSTVAAQAEQITELAAERDAFAAENNAIHRAINEMCKTDTSTIEAVKHIIDQLDRARETMQHFSGAKVASDRQLALDWLAANAPQEQQEEQAA